MKQTFNNMCMVSIRIGSQMLVEISFVRNLQDVFFCLFLFVQ